MKLVPHHERSIFDIKSWPPGEWIAIDQRPEWERRGRPQHLVPFNGLGIVVANDGSHNIRVLWNERCANKFVEYLVERLNPDSIFHVERSA